jgi:hypothetical protein
MWQGITVLVADFVGIEMRRIVGCLAPTPTRHNHYRLLRKKVRDSQM